MGPGDMLDETDLKTFTKVVMLNTENWLDYKWSVKGFAQEHSLYSIFLGVTVLWQLRNFDFWSKSNFPIPPPNRLQMSPQQHRCSLTSILFSGRSLGKI